MHRLTPLALSLEFSPADLCLVIIYVLYRLQTLRSTSANDCANSAKTLICSTLRQTYPENMDFERTRTHNRSMLELLSRRAAVGMAVGRALASLLQPVFFLGGGICWTAAYVTMHIVK